MKTYLMSIPDSIKGVSDKLNVKALLCDKSWVIYNDDGIKIVFIFEKNGSIIISQNGVVVKAKWEYVKANKSILIENNGQTLLLHPTFVDDILFIMQQDGTNLHIVMIDEKEVERLMLKTLEAINKYLVNVSNQHNTDDIEQKRKEQIEKQKEEQLLREQAYKETKDEIESSTAELKRQRKISNIIIVITVICIIISIFLTLLSTHLAVIPVILIVFFIAINLRKAVLDEKIEIIVKEIIDNYLKQKQ